MSDKMVTDFNHYLDESGDIVSESKQARSLAEYFAAIVLIGSYPEPEYPTEYIVKCGNRLKQESCHGEIFAFIIPDTDNIIWMCQECFDHGLIRNWRGSMWDLSESAKTM